MRLARKLLWYGVIQLIVFVLAQPALLHAQRLGGELTTEMLATVNAHLPPNRSLVQQMRLQAYSTSHQEVDLVWHSIPGLVGSLGQDETYARESRSPNSIQITSDKSDLNGPACPCGLLLRGDGIIILGLTSSQEIRSITMEPDNRIVQLEGGARYESDGSFRFQIPNDPQLTIIRFVLLRFSNGVGTLTTVGDLPLKEAK